MTGWPSFRSVQRLRDSIAKTRTEEVRDDNSIGSKVSQVLTDVASSLGFESGLSSQESMPSSSRWERFTGMLERRMQRPQLDNELITVELRGSRSQPHATNRTPSTTARSDSPATVGTHTSAPHSAIRNSFSSARCPSPATSVVSRKSVTFETESLSRPSSQATGVSRNSGKRENRDDNRDDFPHQRTKFVMKEPRPSTPVEQMLIRGASNDSDLRYTSDKYKPALSFDDSSQASVTRDSDVQLDVVRNVQRRSKQPISMVPHVLPRSTAEPASTPKKKKDTAEIEYDFVQAFPTYQKQQRHDIPVDDMSIISEITGMSTAFGPSHHPVAPISSAEERLYETSKLTEGKLEVKPNPSSAQCTVRKLDPILRKNIKYPPTVYGQGLRLALAPPAQYHEDMVERFAAYDSGNSNTVGDDDTRAGDNDYLSFSQLLNRMTECNGRPGGLGDEHVQHLHSEDDREGDADDNSYYALSTGGGSTQISTQSSSSSSTVGGEDLFSLLLCGSGDLKRKASSKSRSRRSLRLK